ncbi:hypothetical protein [Halorubrum sp. AJ67]|uniref:hypothetical protein n=1 Tax=Halorubrum sp. AJ67 TaxID=1173487 RepID=UPI0003DCBC4A|nr:hypothetical protein [Halorubrum sp. AJ67]CDK38321.1 hypothetical protein BN903_521 [Halorubrum sp. AJ67]
MTRTTPELNPNRLALVCALCSVLMAGLAWVAGKVGGIEIGGEGAIILGTLFFVLTYLNVAIGLLYVESIRDTARVFRRFDEIDADRDTSPMYNDGGENR